MNSVNIIGRLTKIPEIRTANNGTKILSNSVAVRRRFKNANNEYESDFINIKAFNQTAEIIANNFNKGSMIGIEGELRTGSYQAQDGTTRYTTDINVANITFVESNNNQQNNQNNPDPSNSQNQTSNNPDPSNQRNEGNALSNHTNEMGHFEIDDDDLPF